MEHCSNWSFPVEEQNKMGWWEKKRASLYPLRKTHNLDWRTSDGKRLSIIVRDSDFWTFCMYRKLRDLISDQLHVWKQTGSQWLTEMLLFSSVLLSSPSYRKNIHAAGLFASSSSITRVKIYSEAPALF